MALRDILYRLQGLGSEPHPIIPSNALEDLNVLKSITDPNEARAVEALLKEGALASSLSPRYTPEALPKERALGPSVEDAEAIPGSKGVEVIPEPDAVSMASPIAAAPVAEATPVKHNYVVDEVPEGYYDPTTHRLSDDGTQLIPVNTLSSLGQLKEDPLAGMTVDQMVDAVLAGKFGNGAARRAALGDRYDAIQTALNQKLAEQARRQASKKSSKTPLKNRGRGKWLRDATPAEIEARGYGKYGYIPAI